MNETDIELKPIFWSGAFIGHGTAAAVAELVLANANKYQNHQGLLFAPTKYVHFVIVLNNN